MALGRLRARGESIATIAKLAGVFEREVRACLKAVPGNGEGVDGAAAPARRPAAAVGMVGKEGNIFRRLIGWSLGMLVVFTVFVYLQSTDVLGWMVP